MVFFFRRQCLFLRFSSQVLNDTECGNRFRMVHSWNPVLFVFRRRLKEFGAEKPLTGLAMWHYFTG